MASESELPELATLFERLFSRHRELSFFLPFILGFTPTPNNAPTTGEDANPVGPDQETAQSTTGTPNSDERILLINPFTQSMVVIEGGGGSSVEALFREFAAKSGQSPASKASIEAMPSVEIGESDVNDGECAICLEEWKIGGVAKQMPCKHRFHGVCIDKWLGMHGTCPVCRYKMPVEEEELGKKRDLEGEGEEGGEERRGSGRAIWVSFSLNGNSRIEDSNQATETDSTDDLTSASPSHDQEIHG